MRLAFLVNNRAEVEPMQSTAALMYAAAARGYDVWAVGVADLEIAPDAAIYATARSATGAKSLADMVSGLRLRRPRRIDLSACDVFMLRTNPGRDPARVGAHESALHIARILSQRGVIVLNDPEGLARAATKMALVELPVHVRPATYIGRAPNAVDAFIHSIAGPVVIKPLSGTRGQDVFRIAEGDRSNQRQIIDVVRRSGGYVMVQEYLADADAGDTRVLVVDGDILEIDGCAAAVARVPRRGDFRSNVHAGGSTQPGVITDGIRDAVRAISGWLRRNGLFLVGLDFIADRIIEVNAFSPGGLPDARKYHGHDYAAAIVDALERRLAKHLASDTRARPAIASDATC